MVHSVYTLDYLKLVRAGIADPPPVSGGKGDQLAKDNEKLQLDLNRQLFSTFQFQLGKQNQITGLLTKMLSPMIQNPTGFSPEALTALRTQATDTNSQQFHDAQTALNDQLAARGGSSTLPSGVDAQLRAGLAGLGAQTESQSQANISLANENQRQTNFWNAIQSLSGNAQVLNPLGYAGGATSGGGALANLSQAYKQSQSSQLLGALGSAGGGVSTGIGGALSKKFGL